MAMAESARVSACIWRNSEFQGMATAALIMNVVELVLELRSRPLVSESLGALVTDTQEASGSNEYYGISPTKGMVVNIPNKAR
jgi:hypothetical protein